MKGSQLLEVLKKVSGVNSLSPEGKNEFSFEKRIDESENINMSFNVYVHENTLQIFPISIRGSERIVFPRLMDSHTLRTEEDVTRYFNEFVFGDVISMLTSNALNALKIVKQLRW